MFDIKTSLFGPVRICGYVHNLPCVNICLGSAGGSIVGSELQKGEGEKGGCAYLYGIGPYVSSGLSQDPLRCHLCVDSITALQLTITNSQV